jgi:hypothetical protein
MPPDIPPRDASSTDQADAKIPETIRIRKPLHRRSWFRRIAFCLACAAGLAAAAALGAFTRWHDERLADLARQQRSLDAFVRSDEFAAFARAADAQVLATLNFIVARPAETAAALPAVAAWERAHGALPWTLQLTPLPVSAAAQPARILAAGRSASALLVRHGFAFDDPQRAIARRLFLRTLAPFLREFLQRSPENDLSAFFLDRRLQENALAAFAARADGTVSDAERLFALYAAVGPRMWQAIDARSGTTVRP